MKKFVIGMTLAASLTLPTTGAFAEGDETVDFEETYEEAIFEQPVSEPWPGTIEPPYQPMYIPEDGYAYQKYSSSYGKEVTWEHDAYNYNGSAPDSVTYTTSRTKYSSGGFSTNAAFQAAVAEVGIGFEVGWGTQDQVTTSIQYSIPAYTNMTCRYGNMKAKTTGYQLKYSNGYVSSKKWIGDARWTQKSFNDKVPF